MRSVVELAVVLVVALPRMGLSGMVPLAVGIMVPLAAGTGSCLMGVYLSPSVRLPFVMRPGPGGLAPGSPPVELLLPGDTRFVASINPVCSILRRHPLMPPRLLNASVSTAASAQLLSMVSKAPPAGIPAGLVVTRARAASSSNTYRCPQLVLVAAPSKPLTLRRGWQTEQRRLRDIQISRRSEDMISVCASIKRQRSFSHLKSAGRQPALGPRPAPPPSGAPVATCRGVPAKCCSGNSTTVQLCGSTGTLRAVAPLPRAAVVSHQHATKRAPSDVMKDRSSFQRETRRVCGRGAAPELKPRAAYVTNSSSPNHNLN